MKYGDIVVFDLGNEKLEYKVSINHLMQRIGENDKIFKMLNITDKNSFCSSLYGYRANSGQFPSSRYEDYEALQRVVDELQRLCAINRGESVLPKFLEEVYFKRGDRLIKSFFIKEEDLVISKVVKVIEEDSKILAVVGKLYNSEGKQIYPKPRKITLSEIADHFGYDKDSLLIDLDN